MTSYNIEKYKFEHKLPFSLTLLYPLVMALFLNLESMKTSGNHPILLLNLVCANYLEICAMLESLKRFHRSPITFYRKV